jgi:nucleoid DNA-binding protein
MITYDYKKVAAELSKKTDYKRKDIEAVQLSVFECVKTVIESSDVHENRLYNARVKGLGIFRVRPKKARYFKNKEV